MSNSYPWQAVVNLLKWYNLFNHSVLFANQCSLRLANRVKVFSQIPSHMADK